MQQCLKKRIYGGRQQAKILLLCFYTNFQSLFSSYERNSTHNGIICGGNERINAVNKTHNMHKIGIFKED